MQPHLGNVDICLFWKLLMCTEDGEFPRKTNQTEHHVSNIQNIKLWPCLHLGLGIQNDEQPFFWQMSEQARCCFCRSQNIVQGSDHPQRNGTASGEMSDTLLQLPFVAVVANSIALLIMSLVIDTGFPSVGPESCNWTLTVKRMAQGSEKDGRGFPGHMETGLANHRCVPE